MIRVTRWFAIIGQGSGLIFGSKISQKLVDASWITQPKGPAMLPRHGRYDLSMIDERPIYDWPNGKRLAFYVGNNIETFAFGAGLGSDPAFRTEARQTQRNHAWRDYGHRVGIWRLLDVLDEFRIPAAHEAESSIHNKYKTKRLSPDEMSKFHTKSGFEECYPIDLMGKLSEEIKML